VKTKRVFVCGVPWQHEIGETDVTVYESPEAVERARECSAECGIVELEVTEVRWVKEQKPLTATRGRMGSNARRKLWRALEVAAMVFVTLIPYQLNGPAWMKIGVFVGTLAIMLASWEIGRLSTRDK
jgi:hypothetical protein